MQGGRHDSPLMAYMQLLRLCDSRCSCEEHVLKLV